MKTKGFSTLLLEWDRTHNKRQMPWKGIDDPYKIWLSEIILQQTRVEQGMGYYTKFVEQYPDVFALAKAPDTQVMKLWEGLGYYSRCRNLLFTARKIVNEYKGKFPQSYEELLQLKGVGPYTAAAISSFAFNKPHAVLDGNVYRVLSRIFAIETPSDSNEGKLQFSQLANELLDKKKPGKYNQAIMDFGATICKPSPVCSVCPMRSICKAFQLNAVTHFPVKEKVLERKNRWFTMFILRSGKKIFVHQRKAKDIWLDLHEFYNEESEKQIKWSKTLVEQWLNERFSVKDAKAIIFHESVQQQLTHQNLHVQFIEIELNSVPDLLTKSMISSRDISKYAFPKALKQFIEKHSIGI
jgi:A/G-specific adenine glycosylase